MNKYHDHEIARLQKTLQQLDIRDCKAISTWLTRHIKTLEADEQLYHITIQQLNLSNRTLNILLYNEISTVGQLVEKSANWDNLRQLKGAGEKVLNEIREKLAELQDGKISF